VAFALEEPTFIAYFKYAVFDIISKMPLTLPNKNSLLHRVITGGTPSIVSWLRTNIARQPSLPEIKEQIRLMVVYAAKSLFPTIPPPPPTVADVATWFPPATAVAARPVAFALEEPTFIAYFKYAVFDIISKMQLTMRDKNRLYQLVIARTPSIVAWLRGNIARQPSLPEIKEQIRLMVVNAAGELHAADRRK
jgi:hypothetical protein